LAKQKKTRESYKQGVVKTNDKGNKNTKNKNKENRLMSQEKRNDLNKNRENREDLNQVKQAKGGNPLTMVDRFIE